MDTIAGTPINNSMRLDQFDLPPAIARFSRKKIRRSRANGNQINLHKSDYKLIYEMACEGYSRASIAQVLRVSESTFLKILARDDNALNALDSGYSGDLQLCTNILRNHAVDGSIHHMKAYLHVQHGIIVGEDQQRASGVQINVQMPFPVATANRVIDDE